ncbi:complement decay-accelerating factor isoform X2 [Choloepus didactylus]|uniref:complement decay-accelerating factor isoform X2 n=1 Tax=Choloepus didactylus TaxID=27675 RepID=UPI00189CC7E5|nr:complement decay-accelerating factor isoform X2 [Choloepus didactylus]
MRRSPGAGSLSPRAMGPAWRSAPAVLGLLGGLPLLLLCPPAARGDCSLPPDIPNAQPALGGLTSFPTGNTVTYKCNKGFVKVPGKPDKVVCLENHKWSEITEFCNRSCDVPTRLFFASLKEPYSKQNYFPVGYTVEYDCRPGFKRDDSLSGRITCLPNLTWSKPAEFCKKKSCPNPGKIKNGHVSITTDILFGSPIFFSCDKGYKLVGTTSSYCSLVEQNVGWSDPLPECKQIFCLDPPQIDNGKIQEQQPNYVDGQSVTYTCTEGFILMGKNSIQCVVNDNQGEWSGQPPVCEESPPTIKVPPAVQKPTTVKAPVTEATPTPQKPTTVNAPATEAPTPQKPTTVNVPGTKVPPTPQKPTTVKAPVTEALPTPQKPTTVKAPVTEAPPTPQKPTTVKAPVTEAPPTPQKPTTVKAPVTEAPPTPQKPTTVKAPVTEAPPTPQKPTTVNALGTEGPTPQKLTTTNAPATEAPPTTQKSSTANATKAPATAQKPPVSKALSTKTLSAALNPVRANASATQATPTAQRFSIANASSTHGLPATQKPTTVHVPVTKGPQTTQRITSSHITATRGLAVPRATTRLPATSISKGRGTLPSDATTLIYGIVAGTLIIGSPILVKIFWDYGRSGSYNTHENNKDMFHHLTVTGDDSELRLSDKLEEDTHV